MPTLTIIRGLPGSGKTTLARELRQPYFEADHFFEDQDGGYHFDASRLSEAHAWCLAQVKASLEAGGDTTVSNTFTRIWEFKPYLDLGYPTRVLVVNGPWRSIHPIPEKSYQAMCDRWES